MNKFDQTTYLSNQKNIIVLLGLWGSLLFLIGCGPVMIFASAPAQATLDLSVEITNIEFEIENINVVSLDDTACGGKFDYTVDVEVALTSTTDVTSQNYTLKINNGDITDDLPDLHANTTVTKTLSVSGNGAGPFSEIKANIEPNEGEDSDPDDNENSASFNRCSTDLEIKATIDCVSHGDDMMTMNYEIINHGPQSSARFQVQFDGYVDGIPDSANPIALDDYPNGILYTGPSTPVFIGSILIPTTFTEIEARIILPDVDFSSYDDASNNSIKMRTPSCADLYLDLSVDCLEDTVTVEILNSDPEDDVNQLGEVSILITSTNTLMPTVLITDTVELNLASKSSHPFTPDPTINYITATLIFDNDTNETNNSTPIAYNCTDLAVVLNVDCDGVDGSDNILATVTLSNHGPRPINQATAVITTTNESGETESEPIAFDLAAGQTITETREYPAVTASVEAAIIDFADDTNDDNNNPPAIEPPCTNLTIDVSIDCTAGDDGIVVTISNDGPKEAMSGTAVITTTNTTATLTEAVNIGGLPAGETITRTYSPTTTTGIEAAITAFEYDTDYGDNMVAYVESLCADLAINLKAHCVGDDGLRVTAEITNNGPQAVGLVTAVITTTNESGETESETITFDLSAGQPITETREYSGAITHVEAEVFFEHDTDYKNNVNGIEHLCTDLKIELESACDYDEAGIATGGVVVTATISNVGLNDAYSSNLDVMIAGENVNDQVSEALQASGGILQAGGPPIKIKYFVTEAEAAISSDISGLVQYYALDSNLDVNWVNNDDHTDIERCSPLPEGPLACLRINFELGNDAAFGTTEFKVLEVEHDGVTTITDAIWKGTLVNGERNYGPTCYESINGSTCDVSISQPKTWVTVWYKPLPDNGTDWKQMKLLNYAPSGNDPYVGYIEAYDENRKNCYALEVQYPTE